VVARRDFWEALRAAEHNTRAACAPQKLACTPPLEWTAMRTTLNERRTR
jgi:hypothetical protein